MQFGATCDYCPTSAPIITIICHNGNESSICRICLQAAIDEGFVYEHAAESPPPAPEEPAPDNDAEPATEPPQAAPQKAKRGGRRWCDECNTGVTSKIHRAHVERLRLERIDVHVHTWKLGDIGEGGQIEGRCKCGETRTYDAHGKPVRVEPSP